ncbi:hypothetical protein G4X40_09505 [Rhodococcus sp. D2-41]|uniref:Uncharacterized protein n=1 Tax=Speluncibacter jeojiensis TaxID=2710754 RepID=A0A9X4RGK4_9ACTN|nr:hypothetical protein [Rhodococcus sp. D2-41]MDG3010384.1 hypothetical protein [Rhodococcus sp. D2-41]MDG3014121.1 hypothetical protein [Corynebacteriales bacterium D3-21]
MDDRVSIGDLGDRLGRIQVRPGSDADHADRTLQPAGLSLSGTVVELLRSALDHLDLASRDGDPHEFAHPTLLRSAITTASTALWMMAGPVDEQCYRTLQFGFRDQVFRHQYLEIARADPTAQAAVDARCDELAAAARTLRPELSERRFHTIDSDSYIVAQAGLLMAPGALGGRDPAVEVLTQWNLLSAYAHGRSWAATVTEGERLDSDSVALAVVDAAVARLAQVADVSGGA